MRYYEILLACFFTVPLGTTASLLPQESPLLASAPSTCDCTGTNDTGPTGHTYICLDPRLGPKRLPRRFPLLSFVSDYDRFGGETPGDFLGKWTKGGYYVYPPQNGFQLNDAGQAILGNMTLVPGTKVDRFGSEYGSYISAADAPYSQRALPPSNLDTPPDAPDYPYNYHIYTVIKPFDVLGGPIAPWFGQPGLGAQFYIGYSAKNILTAIDLGYLEKVNKSKIELGAGRGGGCGL